MNRGCLGLQRKIIRMGSRGLGLFKGALIGSVSQKVVEESKIPVMVIK